MKKRIAFALTVVLFVLSGISLAEGYIFPVEFATPTEAALSMDEAIAIAKEEAIQRQGLAPGFLDKYPTVAHFVTLENDENAWGVTIFGNEWTYLTISSLMISPADGRVLDYQASNTGLYAELLELWEARKGKHVTWSLEEKALFGMLYLESNTQAVPGEGMLSQAEAVTVALSNLPQFFSEPEIYFTFSHDLIYEGTPKEYQWTVLIFERGEEKFQVTISAIDGTVLYVADMGTGLG